MFRNIFSPLVTGFERIQRTRLGQMMRGYRVFRQCDELDRIAFVKQVLTEHSLGICGQHFSAEIMGCGAASGEITVRQYLLVRVGGLNLNRALLLARGGEHGRVVFPLPKEWREILTQQGFEVARFRSALLWQLYVFALLIYGIVKVGKIALAGITCLYSSQPNSKPYVYFADLGPGNLPHEECGNKSHDVISWYLQWQDRKTGIHAIHHSVATSLSTAVGDIEIVSQRGPLPALAGLGCVAEFLLWAVRAIAISAVDLLRGRWWHALLLSQAAMAAQARIVPLGSLAKEYLFHNSGWIYRPLWTYEAEQRGSTILFYFYSTNCESFKRADGYPPMPYGWKAMSWPRYLVWDEYQADFVRRAVGIGASLSIVGDIWFQSSTAEIPRLPPRTIAVFDVQPVRESFYRTLGLDFEYYTPQTAIQFLADIQVALNEQSYMLALKRKRQIGRLAHPAYRHYLETLGQAPNFVAVDPGIDASRLIENCIAVISMPFTSTALLGRDSGKPAIYYDPNGLLQKDDRAAHGIEIVQGQEELRRWLAAVMENSHVDGFAHA